MQHLAGHDLLRSKSIHEFSVGQSHTLKFVVDEALIESFAQFSGDRNPLHIDSAAARAFGYPRQVAHGAITVAFLSQIIGMELPGPGALWLGHSVDWLAPVYLEDEIELEATITRLSVAAGVILLKVRAQNQHGTSVMTAECKVRISEMSNRSTNSNGVKRVALVLGGSRGIGAAITRRLANEGYNVAINCRPGSAAGGSLVRELAETGLSVGTAPGDMADPKDAERMLQKVLSEFGRVDVVVHCATPPIPPVEAASLKYLDIEAYLRTYLVGTTATLAAVLGGMKERRFGRFIFLGTSYMFGIPPVGMAAYVAAKSALWGLSRSLATELGPFGITSNMVSPGLTSTDLTGHISARIKEVDARKSPARRLADVDDTAAIVAFLARDEASYINGANLPVTGGPI
jgi:3-oxoacyl-[acyl-carrier protein] reductase